MKLQTQKTKENGRLDDEDAHRPGWDAANGPLQLGIAQGGGGQWEFVTAVWVMPLSVGLGAAAAAATSLLLVEQKCKMPRVG